MGRCAGGDEFDKTNNVHIHDEAETEEEEETGEETGDGDDSDRSGPSGDERPARLLNPVRLCASQRVAKCEVADRVQIEFSDSVGSGVRCRRQMLQREIDASLAELLLDTPNPMVRSTRLRARAMRSWLSRCRCPGTCNAFLTSALAVLDAEEWRCLWRGCAGQGRTTQPLTRRFYRDHDA